MAMNRRKFLKGAVAAAAALTVAGEMFIPFAEAIEVQKFNFAHITDLHLDVEGTNSLGQYREKSVTLFIDALRQLQRQPKLNFIVFGGDQIHYGPRDKQSLDVFQQWTTQLAMPYYILLGNTEVSPITGVSKLSTDDYIRTWTGKGLRPGRTSWAFNPVRNARVIGFDVTIEGKPHGEAGVDELKWLENELRENRSKKLIIIFTHQVLLPTTGKDTMPEWSLWMVKNHAQVRELLEGFPNVRLVVSGHHHASRVQTTGRITYVADPAVVTYPCAFRTFTVTREGIHLRNVGLEDRTMLNRAKELLETDPMATIYNPAAPRTISDYSAGLTEQDREADIKL